MYYVFLWRGRVVERERKSPCLPELKPPTRLLQEGELKLSNLQI